MFNICKCSLFHFLYANHASLLFAKTMSVSLNHNAAVTTAVNDHIIKERKESQISSCKSGW